MLVRDIKVGDAHQYYNLVIKKMLSPINAECLKEQILDCKNKSDIVDRLKKRLNEISEIMAKSKGEGPNCGIERDLFIELASLQIILTGVKQ